MENSKFQQLTLTPGNLLLTYLNINDFEKIKETFTLSEIYKLLEEIIVENVDFSAISFVDYLESTNEFTHYQAYKLKMLAYYHFWASELKGISVFALNEELKYIDLISNEEQNIVLNDIVNTADPSIKRLYKKWYLEALISKFSSLKNIDDENLAKLENMINNLE